MIDARYLAFVGVIALCPRPWDGHPQVCPRLQVIPSVPGKSLPSGQGVNPVVRSFSARGITSVVLRAEIAENVRIVTAPGSRVITVSGVPEGGAKGYHPPGPNWKETPPAQWGLDFQARSFGATLVISTKAEIFYIHHYYHLSNLVVLVPPEIKLIKENRTLTGEGAADLSPPAAN